MVLKRGVKEIECIFKTAKKETEFIATKKSAKAELFRLQQRNFKRKKRIEKA